MQIQTKNSRVRKRRLIIIASICSILLVVGVYLWLSLASPFFGQSEQQKTTDKTTVNYEDATRDQIDAGNAIKQEFVDKKYGTSDTKSDDAQVDTAINFSSISQTSSTLSVRVIISTTVVSGGSCTLTLKKNTATIVKDAAVQSMGSYAVCQGFDVPLAELPSKGEWNITVTYSGSSGKAIAAVRQVVINE